MRPESPAHLWDAREAARRAIDAIHGLFWPEYADDWIRQAAVERQLEIIGEALNRLERADPSTAHEIDDLRAIIGTRNVIAHGYDVVDHSLVWAFLHDEVPRLAETLDRLLDQAPDAAP